MPSGRPVTRREVTRALCWLPPEAADQQLDELTTNGYSLTREKRRLAWRIGYLVITETYRVPGPPEVI